MFNKIILVVFALGFSFVCVGQNNALSSTEGSTLNVLYRNDAAGKFYANTRGWGILYRQGKHITAKTRSFFEIDLQTLKHPKEVKVSGSAENRKRFVYGKLNSCFLLRGNLGMQNVIFGKADNKAVEIRFAYSVGATFAFAKPYYYQLPNGYRNVDAQEVKFNSSEFTQDSVVGKGRFSTGLSETKIYPGINAKFNLSFEYANYTNLIRAIETGVTIDYFPKALPIMARNPAENIIITLHVGFVFGKKWY